MPASVTILCGPARSGKTERLLTQYRQAIAEYPLGATLWLAPTWRAAHEVRDRLVDGSLPGCFRPGIMTFGKYAETVLHHAKLPIRPVTRLMKRGLVRQIIDQQLAAGRLEFFRNIAATTGLVDMVCEFISELKRLEIWPDEFQRACADRGLQDKDRNLSEIYDLYQQALQQHRLFDEEGRFWSARDVIERGEMKGADRGQGEATSDENRQPLTSFSNLLHPSFIVVDGFTDFTRTQHEILSILARRADATRISLPLEPSTERGDLFAKPLKTLAELQRRHSNAHIEEIARPSDAPWPALVRVEQRLFLNPRRAGEGNTALPPSPASTSAPGIEILAAAKQIGEINEVAARIKQLLVRGDARPGEIAVVFRSLANFSPLVEEVFQRFGIPFVLETGQSLDRSPAIRALLSLLQLDLEDWPFHRLLAVVGSDYFRPRGVNWDATHLAKVERELRKLQIPRGRKRWLDETADDATSNAIHTLTALATAIDRLPQRATLADWGKAWNELAAETGLKAAMAQPTDAQGKAAIAASLQHDHRAWNRLIDAMDEEAALAAWLKIQAEPIDRRAAYETLLDIVGSERLGHAGEESGRVRVLSAASVRSLRVPHLFVAGLSEKAFPPPDREDRIYSEGEYLRLIEAGLPLVARQERMRDEMLLFYEVITRATERLYLSYPAFDEAAQALLPSPFLSEVKQAYAPGKIPCVEQNDLSPIPRGREPLCADDLRVQAMATALDGNVALLAGLFRAEQASANNAAYAVSASLIAGLDTIDFRQERDTFGPVEGMLQSNTIRSYLRTRYPQHHAFAATDLERYASCPFHFLTERVLRLEPIEELALEFDVRRRGQAVHEVLAEFHRVVNQRLGRPGSPLELDEADARTLLSQSIAQCFADAPRNALAAAMWEIDRRLVVEWLSQYLVQFGKYGEQWTGFESPMAPELFEVSFGRADLQPNSISEPFVLVCGETSYRITGRIDRIDTGTVAGHQVFNILDYKTGGSTKLSPESIRQGTTLQLPLYALAAMEIVFSDRDAIPWQAGYWYVRDAGFKPRQALRMYRSDDGRIELEPQWEELRSELSDIVGGLVENIRRGCFPVYSLDDHCTGHCPFSTVCRINQVRSLEKTWQATARH